MRAGALGILRVTAGGGGFGARGGSAGGRFFPLERRFRVQHPPAPPRGRPVLPGTKTFGSTDIDPGERFYYEVRNKVWTFTRSDGLAPKEKILYGGSTVRRWARTFAASGRRGVLLTGLRRGLADGLRQGPRDCHQVMREAGSSIPEVAPRGQGRA